MEIYSILPIIFILIRIFFIILVLLLLRAELSIIRGVMKARKIKKTWLSTPGVVLNSEIKVQQSHSSSGQTTTKYEPQVSYQYQVKDQTYNGNRLGLESLLFLERTTANKKIDVYPQGAQVTVHYDPADPSKAVLETLATGKILMIVIGINIGAIGLGWIIFAL
jgi:hypothetical protein